MSVTRRYSCQAVWDRDSVLVPTMSSDGYFDDELDSDFLNEVDAIEAAHASSPKPAKLTAHSGSSQRPPSPTRSAIEDSESDLFDRFDYDVADLQDIQEGRAAACQYRGPPMAGPSRAAMQWPSSKGTAQTMLLREVASSKPRSTPMHGTHSAQATLAERKTKQWDHARFANLGGRQSAEQKPRKKGMGKTYYDDMEEEPVEVKRSPFVPVG